jgi:hypothetical protein
MTPTSVYKYYDSLGILIYVGITSRGVLRNREHNSDKAWWTHVASQEVEHFDNRLAALSRETQLIQQHFPPFNTQQNPAWEQSRASYLATCTPDADPVSLIRSIQGRLPLVPGDDNSLITVPSLAPLVFRCTLAKMCKVIDSDTNRVFGRVHGMQQVGTSRLLHGAIRLRPAIEVAEAHLKWIPGKESAWEIYRVIATRTAA